MLKLTGVTLSYDAITVLHEINLQVNSGEVVVVLGPNGAGKSSLLKVASGEVEPTQGHIELNGVEFSAWSITQKARQMAVLPQQSLLSFPYTVDEVVALGRTPHDSGAAADKAIVEQALTAVDGLYLQTKIYTHLSGGEKQRVQLARVLAQIWWQQGDAPLDRLLILDEPTSALDYSHQQMVAQQVRSQSASGCSVLTAMHDLNLAASCADKLVLMCCGEIRAVGTVQEVLQTELLKEVFQVEFHRINHPVTGRTWLVN